jgi:hypothetical protein
MKGCVAVADWLGRRGEPLEPERMQFVDKPASSCRGCLFNGQTPDVCKRAGEAALRAEMPDCEKGGVIYVERKTDPRQLAIEVPA